MWSNVHNKYANWSEIKIIELQTLSAYNSCFHTTPTWVPLYTIYQANLKFTYSIFSAEGLAAVTSNACLSTHKIYNIFLTGSKLFSYDDDKWMKRCRHVNVKHKRCRWSYRKTILWQNYILNIYRRRTFIGYIEWNYKINARIPNVIRKKK